MSAEVGIIVGSGLSAFGVPVNWPDTTATPYGEPSSPVGSAEIAGEPVWVLARHGITHAIAPHLVNYRANIWSLRESGCRMVIAVNVVGAIAAGFEPGDIAIPEQLIDYTWGRESTFGNPDGGVRHSDFTEPFDPELRGRMAMAAAQCGHRPQTGIYGVTQGPRLATAAEIDRLERDGCAMVGMTAMPEAVLAREFDIRYVLLAIAVNHAAGRSRTGKSIHEQLEQHMAEGMQRVAEILALALPDIRVTL